MTILILSICLIFVFQSTHPRRVWQDARWCYTHFLEFQSTHPRRVWLTLIGEDFNQSTFQSTHPRRVWPNLATEISKADMFQSTHPRRVWPYKIIQRCKWNSFNPHTHAGCDNVDLMCMNSQCVSIHTPTQGVTPFQIYIEPQLRFQSTHPRRVWLRTAIISNSMTGFNPHTHAGCDLSSTKLFSSLIVSIHTPTQGVTNCRFRKITTSKFQSTHPRRVWLCLQWRFCCDCSFQSTHPRRVWLYI